MDWLDIGVDELKNTYPLYPELRTRADIEGGVYHLWVTTLLRIERDSVYWLVLINQKYTMTDIKQTPDVLGSFCGLIDMIQKRYIASDWSAVIDNFQKK